MNFDDAINAHSDWKVIFKDALKAAQPALDPDVIGAMHLCELGRWLHGEGKAYAPEAYFQRLISLHEQFHQTAADIARRLNTGELVIEEITLGPKSEFALLSKNIVSHLLKLKYALENPARL